MPYQHLKIHLVGNPADRKVFEHADAFLHDVYGMFRTLPPMDDDGGGGNLSIALVLNCVIDGLAEHAFRELKQKERFTEFLKKYSQFWPEGCTDEDKDAAAGHLYIWVRNPLVHNLGIEGRTRNQSILKSNNESSDFWDIHRIDAMHDWPKDLPKIPLKPKSDLDPYQLVAEALYWLTKDAARKYLREIAERPNATSRGGP